MFRSSLLCIIVLHALCAVYFTLMDSQSLHKLNWLTHHYCLKSKTCFSLLSRNLFWQICCSNLHTFSFMNWRINKIRERNIFSLEKSTIFTYITNSLPDRINIMLRISVNKGLLQNSAKEHERTIIYGKFSSTISKLVCYTTIDFILNC